MNLKQLQAWFLANRTLVFPVISLGLIGLVIVSAVSPTEGGRLATVFYHVGLAILIAALVGVVALLQEFRGVFLKHLEEVLLNQKYIDALSPAKLAEIGEKAFRASLMGYVTNRDHQANDMYQHLWSEIYPLLKGSHRFDYDESVNLEFMTVGDLAGVLSFEAPAAVRGEPVCRSETETTYTVVSPREGAAKLEIPYKVETTRVPGLPAELHGSLSLQVGKNATVDVPLKAEIVGHKVRLTGVFTGTYEGKCHVRTKTREVDAEPEMHLVSMAMLTKGFRLTVTSNIARNFDADLFALGEGDDPVTTRNSIRINHRGWLLPSHGAVVSW